MKLNFLYVMILIATAGCFYILKQLGNQHSNMFLGTAETEQYTLDIEHAVAIRQCKVRMGDFVRKGDTLALLYRAELDKKTLEAIAQQALLTTGQQGQEQERMAERQTLLNKQTTLLSTLQARVDAIETEDSLKRQFKEALYPDLPYDNTLAQQKIAALRTEMEQVKKQYSAETDYTQALLSSKTAVYGLKKREIGQQLANIAAESERLVLRAPFDGFVAQVHISPDQLIPAYRDLITLMPQHPGRIVGFIYESNDIPFRLGDSVRVTSAVRTLPELGACITGSSPKLVELPYRLRKFTEVRAWGREVYIRLPADNDFYIGEKIRIVL